MKMPKWPLMLPDDRCTLFTKSRRVEKSLRVLKQIIFDWAVKFNEVWNEVTADFLEINSDLWEYLSDGLPKMEINGNNSSSLD